MIEIDQLIRRQRESAAQRKQTVPLSALRARISELPRPHYLISQLHGDGVTLIGTINAAGGGYDQLSPVGRAVRFQRMGVAALLVVPEFLRAVCEQVRIPVIQHDLIADPYQIYEARAAGADAVVLTVKLMDDDLLFETLSLTQRLIMTALVEVYDEEDLARALPLSPRLIGIASRDPLSGQIDLGAIRCLRDKISRPTTVVSLGGVTSFEMARIIAESGVHAMCVGEEWATIDVGRLQELTPLLSLH